MSSDTVYKKIAQNPDHKSQDKLELFRSRKFYLLCHGCCVFLLYASFAYTNATISTLEKRFHIPSRNFGFILGGFDAGSIFAPLLGYFIAKRHRPKCLSLIVFMMTIYALQNALLHVLYGPGEDALILTKEYGGALVNNSYGAESSENMLCRAAGYNETIVREEEESEFFPQIYLYLNEIFGGMFGAVHDGVGLSYMDDNVPTTRMPMYLSVIQMLRTLAPLLGFNLATIALGQYIAPSLTPIIDERDTRWLGAWWMGWLVLGAIMVCLSVLISRFPKTLKRKPDTTNEKFLLEEKHPSMRTTISRIMKNKIFIYNLISTMGSTLAAQPYWIYTAKYIEVQYKISASDSSFLFGTIVQTAAAAGTLVSGYVVYKIKPSARRLVLFNIFIAVLSAVLIYFYTLFDCKSQDSSSLTACIPDCECGDVKFNPICGDDGTTYVSPCHAGCTNIESNSTMLHFTNCTCIMNNGGAYSGSCPVDCSQTLILLLFVMSISSFISNTSKSNIYLFAMRAVDPVDKTVALATMITIISYFALIPAPVIYGWIIDQTCIFWDNATAGTGNCWQYDENAFRFDFNVVAIIFTMLGALFGDVPLWFSVKNLKLFDDDEEETKEFENQLNNNNKSVKDIIL